MDHWSNWGLTEIKFYDPHTSVDGDTTPTWPHSQHTSLQSCGPPMKLPPSSSTWPVRSWVRKVQIKQLGWRRRQPLWLWHVTEKKLKEYYPRQSVDSKNNADLRLQVEASTDRTSVYTSVPTLLIISYHQICYGANPPELSSALHNVCLLYTSPSPRD